MQYLISTDLDGTLLDHHDYSWAAAMPAINECARQGVPIIFNTSKTADEALNLQKKVGLTGPVIVENGSALLFDLEQLGPITKKNIEELKLSSLSKNVPQIDIAGSQVECVFGVSRTLILEFIKKVRYDTAWQFEGFNDWSVDQIASRTGLSKQDVTYACHKAYSEPLVWNDTEQSLADFVQLADQAGFNVLRGGRFYHLQGKTNKAVPIAWLKEHMLHLSGANSNQGLQADRNKNIKLICLGDNHNDIDMLNIADYPVCVRSPVASFPKLSTDKEILFTEGEGPIGWNQAILKILQTEKN